MSERLTGHKIADSAAQERSAERLRHFKGSIRGAFESLGLDWTYDDAWAYCEGASWFRALDETEKPLVAGGLMAFAIVAVEQARDAVVERPDGPQGDRRVFENLPIPPEGDGRYGRWLRGPSDEAAKARAEHWAFQGSQEERAPARLPERPPCDHKAGPANWQGASLCQRCGLDSRWWGRLPERPDESDNGRCDRCGQSDYAGLGDAYWFADNDLWNEIAGDANLLCPRCFTDACRAAGVGVGWRVGRVGEIETRADEGQRARVARAIRNWTPEQWERWHFTGDGHMALLAADRVLTALGAVAGRQPADERTEKARDALEGVSEFLERVTTWTGADPDEVHEIAQQVDDALAILDARPPVASRVSEDERAERD